jgi:Flp pilus assembly protein TadD
MGDAAMRAVFALIAVAAPLSLSPVAQAQVRSDPYAAVAIRSGDLATAERQLLNAQRRLPSYPEVMINLAAIYATTGRHAEARALYRRVLAQEAIDLNVSDGQVAPSHLIAERGLRQLDAARQAAR